MRRIDMRHASSHETELKPIFRGTRLQVQVPGFGDEFLAEALVLLLGDELKIGLLVDVASRGEIALRPKRNFPVANLAGETDTFIHETLADSESAGGRLNQQEAEFLQNKPVLSIVGTTDPGGQPDPDYQEGHWVVVIGISADKTTIEVFDPTTGLVNTVPYNAQTYEPGVYWENSSYF